MVLMVVQVAVLVVVIFLVVLELQTKVLLVVTQTM
jgi:hypothetical protein